jgi:hypothetical protein
MDFEKKYPLTQQPGEYVLAQWSKGYRSVELYFNDELLGEVHGAAKLKKGTQLIDTAIGNIDLKLSENPILLDVIVDGYHSPVNVSHPHKELKKTSTFFWIIATLSLIAGSFEIGVMSDWDFGLRIAMIVNIPIFASYIVSAIFIYKGKIWAYYFGFSVFAFSTFLGILLLYGEIYIGWLWYLFQLFRFAALAVLIYNLKTANSARKHARHGMIQSDDLLDYKLF